MYESTSGQTRRCLYQPNNNSNNDFRRLCRTSFVPSIEETNFSNQYRIINDPQLWNYKLRNKSFSAGIENLNTHIEINKIDCSEVKIENINDIVIDHSIITNPTINHNVKAKHTTIQSTSKNMFTSASIETMTNLPIRPDLKIQNNSSCFILPISKEMCPHIPEKSIPLGPIVNKNALLLNNTTPGDGNKTVYKYDSNYHRKWSSFSQLFYELEELGESENAKDLTTVDTSCVRGVGDSEKVDIFDKLSNNSKDIGLKSFLIKDILEL